MRIRVKLAIPCEGAVAHKVVNEVPMSPIVGRVMGLGMTVAVAARSGAIFVANPYETVTIAWVELHDLRAEAVWRIRGLDGVPVDAGVGCVIIFIGSRDEECTIIGEFMMVECQEPFLGDGFLPMVAFVTRLPDGLVSQADEDGLKVNREQSF